MVTSSHSGVGRWTWKSMACMCEERMIIRMVQSATLLLLAGGKSRRMGRPKPLLPVGRSTLVEWMVERLAPGFDQLLVSARDERQLPERLRTHLVLDLHPGAGPLAGIEAGLAASRHQALVAVACDMPGVGLELTRRLLAASEGHDAAVPRVGERPEPMCAAYRRSAGPPISALLDAEHTVARDREVVLDPGDEYGIEEGLQLREMHGGEVVLVSMGPERAREAIRKGLSMGADRGILITDDDLSGADGLLTAKVL